MFTPSDVQILSLSATIGNNVEINDWIASTKGRKKGVAVTPDSTYKPDTRKIETVLINVPSENRHVPLNFEIVRYLKYIPNELRPDALCFAEKVGRHLIAEFERG